MVAVWTHKIDEAVEHERALRVILVVWYDDLFLQLR